MANFCNDDIIKDSLIAYIDISDIDSWNLNSGLTVTSLYAFKDATTDEIELKDFGLTLYDNSRVNDMGAEVTLTEKDNKLKLFRVGYNDASGNTFYDTYNADGIIDNQVGNYFLLNGGYLQGFFKLEDYNFEILPYRYAEGVTIESILYISANSFNDNSFFLHLGQRAEDKYFPYFSGETYIQDDELTGITTSEGNLLDSPLTGYTDSHENIIGFLFNSEGQIGYKYINENGIIKEGYSNNIISETGWTQVGITFKPYEDIDDPDLLECYPTRLGDLIFSINGRNFTRFENFNEFWFKGLMNSREKQIGVPYTISWGGGTFGLKHSYHYDFKTNLIYKNQDQSYVNELFTDIPVLSGCTNMECIFALESTLPLSSIWDCPIDSFESPQCGEFPTFIALENNDLLFDYWDCLIGEIGTGNTQSELSFTVTANTLYEGNIPESCIEEDEIGNMVEIKHTGNSDDFMYLIRINEAIELDDNIEYKFQTNLYDTGIFNPSIYSYISFYFEAENKNDIEIINNDMYVFDPMDETPYSEFINKWNEINLTIKSNTEQNINIYLLIHSDQMLVNNFVLYLDELKYSGRFGLTQDTRKQNLKIQRNFDGSFKGGIQKLRIYNKALSIFDIRHNWQIEVSNYNKIPLEGGRIIYI
ncbi:MAG: hypothetical protein ACOC33_03105 [bacterium]